jgi:hypothetical protein
MRSASATGACSVQPAHRCISTTTRRPPPRSRPHRAAASGRSSSQVPLSRSMQRRRAGSHLRHRRARSSFRARKRASRSSDVTRSRRTNCTCPRRALRSSWPSCLRAGAACATTRASGGLEVRAGARAVYMLKRPRQRKIAQPVRQYLRNRWTGLAPEYGRRTGRRLVVPAMRSMARNASARTRPPPSSAPTAPPP